MKKENSMMIVWVLIVLVVIAGLVYITINKKVNAPVGLGEQFGQTEQNTNINMGNSQNVKGVKVAILKEGTGAVAKTGDTVNMNYTGMLVDGTVFDSNIDPKFNHVESFTFTIGAGQVIKGWDIGIAGMKVGEQRKLELAPDFAYGANGVGPIPPNATLIFTVELLGIK